jgi:hypothetical protein
MIVNASSTLVNLKTSLKSECWLTIQTFTVAGACISERQMSATGMLRSKPGARRSGDQFL